MQEIKKELNRIRRIEARLCKQGETLTEEEAKLRESLSYENSYQSDDGEVDMLRAKDLVANLKAHIKLIAKLTTIRIMRQALEVELVEVELAEAKDRASKPENQAEATQ